MVDLCRIGASAHHGKRKAPKLSDVFPGVMSKHLNLTNETRCALIETRVEWHLTRKGRCRMRLQKFLGVWLFPS